MGIAMGSEGESAGVNAQDPGARKIVEKKWLNSRTGVLVVGSW